MQSKDIIEVLESDDAKSFILNHINDDFTGLSLKYSGKTSFNITVCLQLMELYTKARNKIPLFFDQFLALDKRSYEQCTSQKVAIYKSTFICGTNLLDVTGGIGVDSLFLAKSFKQVDAVEQNHELHLMACYNLKKLGIQNIHRIHGEGSSFIRPTYSWIYIDPDRRKGAKRAVVLQDLEPNVLELLPLLQEATTQAYIKLSPLYDLDEVIRVFEHVNRIHVIAEKGEIKEVGVSLNFVKNETVSIALKDVGTDFSFDSNLKAIQIPPVLKNARSVYFLVPNALLLKSRLADQYLGQHPVLKHAAFQYYFSNKKILDVGFRTFKILGQFTISSKELIRELRERNISQINIVIKGLADKPSTWHKKLKTTDGGLFYLFILKSKEKESILCEFIPLKE